jgi:hypothetical protein
LKVSAVDAALFIVGGIAGEGQVAMDSVASRQVDRRGVDVEVDVRDEDGGEGWFGIVVTNPRQHRVW